MTSHRRWGAVTAVLVACVAPGGEAVAASGDTFVCQAASFVDYTRMRAPAGAVANRIFNPCFSDQATVGRSEYSLPLALGVVLTVRSTAQRSVTSWQPGDALTGPSAHAGAIQDEVEVLINGQSLLRTRGLEAWAHWRGCNGGGSSINPFGSQSFTLGSVESVTVLGQLIRPGTEQRTVGVGSGLTMKINSERKVPWGLIRTALEFVDAQDKTVLALAEATAGCFPGLGD